MIPGPLADVPWHRGAPELAAGQEKRELAGTPEAELTALYEARGLSASTARTVAAELTARNALAAHLDAELHINLCGLRT
jgi:hypothetical protein